MKRACESEKNQLSGHETDNAILSAQPSNTITKYCPKKAEIWQPSIKGGGTNILIGGKTSKQVMSFAVDMTHDA